MDDDGFQVIDDPVPESPPQLVEPEPEPEPDPDPDPEPSPELVLRAPSTDSFLGGIGRPGSSLSMGSRPGSTGSRPGSMGSRPGSMGADGVTDGFDIADAYLEEAGFGRPPRSQFNGPPKPAGDPILYKDLNRTRAIMRTQRKVSHLEESKRALEVQQQALTVDYSTALIEVEEELLEARTKKLDEVTDLAERVNELEGEIDSRKKGDEAVAEEQAKRTYESARLKQQLENAEEKQNQVERRGASSIRELEFQVDGLSTLKDSLEKELVVTKTGESEALHRAEAAEAEAGALREEMKKHTWELRKVKNMCKNLQAHSQTADEIRREKQLVQNALNNAQEAGSTAASEALARERDLLEKLHTARDDVKRDREIAEVRQEEIVLLRDQIREKELVITELARINATLEVQEARLETLVRKKKNPRDLVPVTFRFLEIC